MSCGCILLLQEIDPIHPTISVQSVLIQEKTIGRPTRFEKMIKVMRGS